MEPSIQFTLEREKDRHSPFFDLNVCRAEQGNLKTSVYRKPTHANKYLASDSHHSIRHKKSYYQRLCLEAWNINSAHAPLNRNDGGLLNIPDTYSPRQKKGQLISEHIGGLLVAAIR